MRIVPLTEDLVPPLRDFLARLTAAGRTETFDTTPARAAALGSLVAEAPRLSP